VLADYRPSTIFSAVCSMPINWDIATDDADVAQEMIALMRELFPVPRSLTGGGVRETLTILGREIDLETIETPSGTKVFDWSVPREWTIRGGWIDGPDGVRVVDFADSPLHVLGYSVPVDTTVSLDELRRHVFTHREDPDLVPYRTSYWQEQWGFCMSARTLESLPPGDYRVVIDSTLADGSLTSGELRIPGSSEKEFLLSTHICHPALANDNLSGVVLLWALAKTLARQELRYTYRLLWSPGTLGPLCWLARNLATLDRVEHGLSISCVGDQGPLRYKRSRRGNAPIDRAASLVVGKTSRGIVGDWEPLGGDERQFCSPGFDLPVGALSRTPHGHFPEYHSSGDNVEFVSAASLAGSYREALAIIDLLERNAVYANRSPYGEPQLGKRGLYQGVPDGTFPESALLWVLSLSDGSTDLLTITERSGLPFEAVRAAAATLEEHELLERFAASREVTTTSRSAQRGTRW
jgi:aminopeptidase-like protein